MTEALWSVHLEAGRGFVECGINCLLQLLRNQHSCVVCVEVREGFGWF